MAVPTNRAPGEKVLAADINALAEAANAAASAATAAATVADAAQDTAGLAAAAAAGAQAAADDAAAAVAANAPQAIPANLVTANVPGVTFVVQDTDPGPLGPTEIWVAPGDTYLRFPEDPPNSESLVTVRPDGTQGLVTAGSIGTAGGGSSAIDVTTLAKGAVIPHRGAGRLVAPENTREGFRVGASYGLGVIDGGDWYTTSDGALACFHDSTVDRTTTSTGNVTDQTAAGLQGLVVDPSSWFGGNYKDTTVPTAEDVFSLYGDVAVLCPEPKSAAAATKLADLVRRMGMQRRVLPNSFDATWLTPFVAVGCPTVLLNVTAMPTQAQMDSYKSMGITIIGITYNGSITTADVSTLKVNGFKVMVGTTVRHIDYTTWANSDIDLWASDDPLYFASIVNPANAARYRRTTDPFNSQTYYHGMQGSQTNTIQTVPVRRGTFLRGNAWGFQSRNGDTTGQNFWGLQGWNCPLPNPTQPYVISGYVTFDALGNDATRWPGWFFAQPTDTRYSDVNLTSETGYMTRIRVNGSIEILRKTAGVGTTAVTLATAAPTAPLTISAALAAGTAITAIPVNAIPTALAATARFALPTGQTATLSAAVAAGATSLPVASITPNAAVASGSTLPQTIPWSVTFTDTTVTWTRTDTVESVAMTGQTDVTARGAYWHLGTSDTNGTTGLRVSFSQIVSV